MQMKRDPGDFVQLKLRLREETRERLDNAAGLSGRSLNSELVARLEHSLRADESYGGGEQARLVTGLVRIMDEVSTEFGKPWWMVYAAWRLVFRACWYMFIQYKPDRAPKFSELLSSEGKVEVERWNKRYDEVEKRHLEEEGRRIALSITHKVMRDGYTAARLLELKADNSDPAPPPNLNEADMAIWRQLREDEETMATAWLQALPVLQSTRRRRRKARGS